MGVGPRSIPLAVLDDDRGRVYATWRQHERSVRLERGDASPVAELVVDPDGGLAAPDLLSRAWLASMPEEGAAVVARLERRIAEVMRSE